MSAVLQALRGSSCALGVALAIGSCSSGPLSVGDNRPLGLDAGGAGGGDTNAAGSAGSGSALEPNAADLLPILAQCRQVSSGLLAPRSGQPADISVCGLSNAVFWKSQMAVDCDGLATTICNLETDPQFRDSTVGKDSAGNSLDAAVVPYVEVPVPNSAFDYLAAGLSMGSVVAIIYQGRLAYGVIGHEQAAGQIGEGSYALASVLGIDPNPVTGGLQDKDVYYVAFTGPSNVVPALEDAAAIATFGKAAATTLSIAGR
jgi:hypothetical protein